MGDVVKQYYENHTDENGRADRNPIEYIRTREIISRYLTRPNMIIADIGGASGAYSFWLAEMGHQVHLFDLADKHIAQAKERSARTNISLQSYTSGDARVLPYSDQTFDVVLLMGPLYHLPDRRDRIRCLSEAYRVLRNGGLIVCAYISRYASLIDGFKFSLVDDDYFLDILASDVETGRHNNEDFQKPYFTTAYLHTSPEIMEEMQEADFKRTELIAVEGFANALNDDTILANDRRKKLLLEYIRKTETIPELMGISGHLIGIGVKIVR